MPPAPLTRTEVSRAVGQAGWRLVLGWLAASVPVGSLAAASEVAAALVAEAGERADDHLRIDLRSGRVELAVTTWAEGWVSGADVELALRLAAVVDRRGWRLAAPTTTGEGVRPVQGLEVAIDTLDADAIRPFWRVVLGLVDDGSGALVDPAGQLPALWFQQMDRARPQRNRIHLDVTVADDEAWPRVEAALAAGGRLVSDTHARMFWVLADAEGNECCVCTWTDRDDWQQAHS